MIWLRSWPGQLTLNLGSILVGCWVMQGDYSGWLRILFAPINFYCRIVVSFSLIRDGENGW